MLHIKSFFIIYLLVAVAFTNVSTFTIEKFGIPVLPILFAFAGAIFFFNLLKADSYPIQGYMSTSTYIINFFFLLLLSFGLINADLNKALKDELYLLMAAFFTFHLLLLYVQKHEEMEVILLTAVLCTPIIALQGGYDFFIQLSSGAFADETRASGWWLDPNAYAIVLDLIYIISFYFINKKSAYLRWAGYLAQVSAAAGVFLSLSRGGIIIFMLITLFNWRIFFSRKFYLAAVLAISLSIYAVVSLQVIKKLDAPLNDINIDRLLLSSDENKDDYSNGRSSAATSGMAIYYRHPLIGAGFGNILDEAYIVNNYKIHSHNMFIEILALSGPIPLLGYLFMLWYLYQSVPKKGGGEKDLGPFLRQFIIVIVVAGFFLHLLVFMKPVWIMLALFPIYTQLCEVDHEAAYDNRNVQTIYWRR